jgi:hypothetical protein
MKWIRSEEEVDKIIADMISRNNSRNITQGVTFNKTCPRQMGLLKKALMSSTSFSGLAKEMLAVKFNDDEQKAIPSQLQQVTETQKKDTGNFF